MAVRGPSRPEVGKVRAPGEQGPPLSPLESALLKAGIAKTPVEARVLARSLVAALKQAGFPAAPQGGVEEQLRSFQRARGLPETGTLDQATRAHLVEVGILPKGAEQKPDAKADARLDARVEAQPSARPAAELAPTLPKAWGDFGHGGAHAGGQAPSPSPSSSSQPGERHHTVQHEQARARAELMKDGTPKDLSALLGALGNVGFHGAGKGKQRLEGALKALQHQAGLSTTGRLDAGTVRELIRRGVLPESTPLPEEPRGVPAHQSELRATEGRGETAGHASGRAGQGGDGVPDGARAEGGAVAHGDVEGAIDDDANAPAGDERWDDHRRGHAQLDEDEADEGHYEIPPLPAQARAALERIARNDEPGAPTYSWDVTFYEPGIYGARQPAPALWHFVVERAGAFDPVWEEAQRALAERIGGGDAPTRDDFVLALRRARVR